MRSGFETRITDDLRALGVAFTYEPFAIPYRDPSGRLRKYHPDILLPNGILTELKGRMTRDDLVKFRCLRNAYPRLDLRFVIERPRVPVTRRQGSSIEGWCRRHGYPVAVGSIPLSWLTEPETLERTSILADVREAHDAKAA